MPNVMMFGLPPARARQICARISDQLSNNPVPGLIFTRVFSETDDGNGGECPYVRLAFDPEEDKHSDVMRVEKVIMDIGGLDVERLGVKFVPKETACIRDADDTCVGATGAKDACDTCGNSHP